MAAGLNVCSSHGSSYQVRQSVWGGVQGLVSQAGRGGGGGGGGVTWPAQAMEVKGQLISAPEPVMCPDRKQRERMAELQERRRSLQALLSARLAELRRICLQEAELTGAVPSDFPLEAGEKPPYVRRRATNRKCRSEEDETQRCKPKKTLFSSALRKHSDPEHNAHAHTHTHNGKRTVHRGCHTDDTVRSESSSTSDSTGHDNEEAQCRPPLVSAGSPVEVFYQNKPRRNSVHQRSEPPHRPLPLPHAAPLLLQPPPPPPPRSHDSSSSSGPSEPGAAPPQPAAAAAAVPRRSDGEDGAEDEAARGEPAGLWVNGGPRSRGTAYRSSETLADGRAKTNQEAAAAAGRGRGREAGRAGGAAYSDVLLDYVWGKQLQRQQSQPGRQPVGSQLLYNGSSQKAGAGAGPGAAAVAPPPPTYREQQRAKVTRTKSCGPFLPPPPPPQQQQQQSAADSHNAPAAIQPDPHPHLLPPRPPQQPPSQEAQLEEATRSLHKALALEGLRDWYLRNTLGSGHGGQANGKAGAGGKGQAGGPLQRRRTTHGVSQLASYQTEACHQAPPPHQPAALPHSATFHGQPSLARSVESCAYHESFRPHKQEVPLRDPPAAEQPSPGTLV